MGSLKRLTEEANIDIKMNGNGGEEHHDSYIASKCDVGYSRRRSWWWKLE